MVPETYTWEPSRIALEYPTIGSHGVPLEMSCLGGFGEGKTYSPACCSFQRAMHRARVSHEIGAGPWIGREEIIWKEIGFQPIAVRAGENDVALMVDAAMGERVNVVKRRRVDVERCCAVDAAATTVTHGRALDGALEAGPAKLHDAAFAAPDAGETGESDVVTVSSNGHFTSLRRESSARATALLRAVQ